jgi:hypothetical protein
MEEPEDPGGTDRNKKRPDLVEKIKDRAGKDTSVIKTGWKALCEDLQITERVEEIIPEVTRIRVETCLLLNLHFTRLIEEGKDLPVIEQNLVGRAMQCIYSRRLPADLGLAETFYDHYLPRCPNRPASSCLPKIANILLDLRNQLLSNIKNHVAVHFVARHRTMMRILIKNEAGTVPFFADRLNLESCTRILTTATLWRHEESIEGLLPENPRLRGISEEGVRKLQEIADFVRLMVGPLPASPKQSPHLYMPWMHYVGREFAERKRRSFSLIPHAGFSAPFIAITPTTWPELRPKSKKADVGKLRDAFPLLNRLETAGKRFAQRIVTDGVSASVHFLVDARPAAREDQRAEIRPDHRVVGLDPGKSPDFLTGIAVQGDWEGATEQEKVLHLKSREFYQRAGHKRRTFVMGKWMRENLYVDAFNREAPALTWTSLAGR